MLRKCPSHLREARPVAKREELLVARVLLAVAHRNVQIPLRRRSRARVARDGRERRLGKRADEDELAGDERRDEQHPRPRGEDPQCELVDLPLDHPAALLHEMDGQVRSLVRLRVESAGELPIASHIQVPAEEEREYGHGDVDR